MTKIHVLGSSGYYPSEDRHTSCFMIPEDGILLDAGTGIFRMRSLLQTNHLDIFLSHVHLDHSCGLTYLLGVLWEKPIERVTVHCRPDDAKAIREVLFDNALFPVTFGHESRPLETPIEVGSWTVRWREQTHPGGSIGYRFEGPQKSFAYITDTTSDPEDEATIQFLSGVDLLIHECHFTAEHSDRAQKSGHTTSTAAAKLAHNAEVLRLLLTHINPLAQPSDLEQLSREIQNIFPASQIATDNMVIEI